MKQKNKFQDYKYCLEVTQLQKGLIHLEESKTVPDSLRENHDKSLKKDKLILKSRQRFRSKKHNNLITEEANIITLSTNNDKKITFNRFNRIKCIWNEQSPSM